MQKIISTLFFLILYSFHSFSATDSISVQPFQSEYPVISFAKKHLNIRYRSGGTSPNGFDCSGFMRYCFGSIGLLLPHSSAAQGQVGESIEKKMVVPGDLIFFKGSSLHSNRIGHVGMVVEASSNAIKFIHSAYKGGIRYSFLNEDYYRKRYVGVRRVTNLLGSATIQLLNHPAKRHKRRRWH